MPLLRTPPNAKRKIRNKIRSQNIETEYEAGKPLKQAEAIAYSVERGGKKRRKKGK